MPAKNGEKGAFEREKLAAEEAKEEEEEEEGEAKEKGKRSQLGDRKRNDPCAWRSHGFG